MKPSINDFEQYYTQIIAYLIAYMEGYFEKGTIPQKYNNPGDLRSWGAYPVQNGFVIFPSPLDGWNALMEQVWLNINRGLTLREFFQGKEGVYPGYDKTNPFYADFISKYSHIPIDGITIADYIQSVTQSYQNTQNA